jgi:diaminopimelate decarboxylase
MIHQLGRLGTHRSIVVRVNPGFGHGHHQKTNTGGLNSKHGIWHERLPEAIQVARQYGLDIHGIHIHLGSGADAAELLPAADAMERLVEVVGATITLISAGGGLSVPYRESDSRPDLQSYVACWQSVRQRISESLGHAVRLEVEPGRYLVAESGFLIAQILAVQIVGQRRFYLLDAGFHALARPVLYGAYHPITACPRPFRNSLATSQSVVGGPLCESGDIFTQGEGGFVETRLLPELSAGDLVVFGVAGAYGMSMASNYNSYPRPAEVLIEGGAVRLIRRRETIDDLLQCERDANRQ